MLDDCSRGECAAAADTRIKVTVSADTLRMLRLLATEAAARDGGPLNLSAVVTAAVREKWAACRGPKPPLAPEPPPSMMLQEGRA